MQHATKHLDPHSCPWQAAYGYERPWRERAVWHSQTGPRSSLWKRIMLHVHRYYRMLPAHYQRMLRTITLPAKNISDALQRTYLGETLAELPVYCFPGSIPFSFTRADIRLLYNGMKKYVFLYKSDGARYLLGFVRVRERPVAFLMDRRARITLLRVEVPASFYEGTIFDGELVKTVPDGRLQFQVFDVVCVQDRLVGHYDYVTRMDIGHRLFQVWIRLQAAQAAVAPPPTAIPAPSTNAEYRQEALRFLASIAPTEAPAPTSTTEAQVAVWQGFTEETTTTAPVTNTTAQQQPQEDDDDDPEEELKAMMRDFNLPYTSKEDEKKRRTEAWVKEQIVLDIGAPFQLTIKQPYSLWNVRSLIRDVIPYMPFACDGIIAQPVEDPIQMGPCRNIKKWKRVHSLDLFWRTLPPPAPTTTTTGAVAPAVHAHSKSILAASPFAAATMTTELVCVGLWVEWPERETSTHPIPPDVAVTMILPSTGGKHPWRGVLWDKLWVPPAPAATKQEAKRHGNYKTYEDRVVEVQWDTSANQWRVTNVRKDKSKPNTLSTASVTWRDNILTNPSLEEVFPFLHLSSKDDATDLRDHKQAEELLLLKDPTITEPLLAPVDHEHAFQHLLTQARPAR